MSLFCGCIKSSNDDNTAGIARNKKGIRKNEMELLRGSKQMAFEEDDLDRSVISNTQNTYADDLASSSRSYATFTQNMP